MWQFLTILLSLTLLAETDTTRSVRQELVAGEETPHFFAHFLDGGDFFLSRYIGTKTLSVLLDPYGKISEKYLAGVTPTLVIITSAGKIDLYKRGYKETDKELIKQTFERLSGSFNN
jgi:hypothetical protein